MTDPTVTLNPTEQLVAAANASVDVSDARGRTITLRKPGVLAQFRLVEGLGDAAANTTYVGMVLPLIYVGAINGDAVAPLTTKRQAEALIQRLDEDGINAVMQGVQEHFGKQDLDAAKDDLKKD